jgi:L-aspartate oxidase
MTPFSALPIDIRETYFLIIGSGIAGLRAAIELAPHGSVVIVNKGRSLESTTEFAQGGIAVVFEEEDSIRSHLEDTLRTGKGLCSREAVEILVQEGPMRIKELMDWGARFDQEEGRYVFAKEGGHSHARILRAGGDATGTEILKALAAKAAALPSIVQLNNHFSMDLLVSDGTCLGAVLLDEDGSRLTFIKARAVLMASGGAGQVYVRTTNPAVATGDGMAMAYRAGAHLADMEFVQFHPTALSLPEAPPFLLTEAMRGEGARLLNPKGEAFMTRYHPDKELAPRDVVARAIWREMQMARTRHVFLDITHRQSSYLKTRFPTIYRTCLKYGIDISRERIPVSPSAHFMIGGIQTDTQGATTLPGLFAAGEVATCGVHGANRLASNSLLEGLVFGTRAAQTMVRVNPAPPPSASVLTRTAKEYARKISSLEDPGLANIESDRLRLSQLMWDKVGMVRTKSSLTEALELLGRFDPFVAKRAAVRRAGELQNLATVAKLIARAALLRDESRGVHYRTDYPEESTKWLHRHIRFQNPDRVGYFKSVA